MESFRTFLKDEITVQQHDQSVFRKPNPFFSGNLKKRPAKNNNLNRPTLIRQEVFRENRQSLSYIDNFRSFQRNYAYLQN